MKLVPLIASNVSGPLGVSHLPRLWLKLLLDARGLLAEGYTACDDYFDRLLLEALHIDPLELQAFVRDHFPSYPQLEDWVVARNRGAIAPSTIDHLNYSILSYNHPEEVRVSILGANGMDEGDGIHDAVSLNNLDDWQAMHATLGAKPAETSPRK